jgi:glutamyl-tRNA reductase
MEEELAKTLKHIPDATPEMEKHLREMIFAISKKVNHEPISFLKRRHEEEEAGERYIDITRRMFNLDRDNVTEKAHPHRRRS